MMGLEREAFSERSGENRKPTIWLSAEGGPTSEARREVPSRALVMSYLRANSDVLRNSGSIETSYSLGIK
jgi:hypothetical protein